MKVTLVNTSDRVGGAAVACYRLLQALNQNNVDAKLLVQKKSSNDYKVFSAANSLLQSKRDFYRFAYERLIFSLKERSKEVRFAFSLANTGRDISKNEIIREADIIHLHWINFGYLSLKSLEKVLSLNKPVMWTLHDMWAFTGGCHYCGDCNAYLDQCGNCPFLKHPDNKDISNFIWNKKHKLLENKDITFVTCSKWLADIAKKSSLLKNFRIESVPNPIDTALYKPISKVDSRKSLNLQQDKIYLLFGSMNLGDKRKGFAYLKEALEKLDNKYPALKSKMELIVFGKSSQDVFEPLPFRINDLGMLKEESKIVEAYNAADLFVLPSLEDNLPNTIMESLACGTPVVAFDTGGIPEMVEHLNAGYLASYKNPEDLANGIYNIGMIADKDALSVKARERVMKYYNFSVVASTYNKLYLELLNSKV
jgi:glycosyltransferase involved in cell wall biosynthesis